MIDAERLRGDILTALTGKHWQRNYPPYGQHFGDWSPLSHESIVCAVMDWGLLVPESRIADLEADNAKLRAALVVWEAAYDNTLMRSGVCCCGEEMETHSNPMYCGHSPVDSGEYYASSAIMQTRAALEETK